MTEIDALRYARQIALPQLGNQGQARLGQGSALVVGLGGLGATAALYLGNAGVGHLVVNDYDRVDASNLPRQILFQPADVGEYKTHAASEKLKAWNPDLKVSVLNRRLDDDELAEAVGACTVVLDCTDNFHSRYLINDICHHLQIPWIYASVLRMQGQLALLRPGQSCFRCLFPELGEAPDCNQAGVLGAVPGLLGSLQALEAIKYLADYYRGQDNRLYTIDGTDMSLRPTNLGRSPECVLCNGKQSYRDRLADYRAGAGSAVFNADFSNHGKEVPAAQFEEFVRREKPLLIDVRSLEDHLAYNLGGINVPLDELVRSVDRLRATSGPVLFYCQGGVRSRKAQAIALEHGLENVLSLAGGVQGQD